MVKALIIIDMVNGFMGDTHNPKNIIKNQISLIKEFKKKKLPVILVFGKDRAKPNSVMDRLWGVELEDNPDDKEVIKDLLKFKYDKIVKKPEYDIFYKTDFEKYCKQKGIDKLYFTGVFSGACIFFSAAGAAIRDIQPYLVKNASGSPRRDLVSKSWENDTYNRFKLLIGPVVTTNSVIKSL